MLEITWNVGTIERMKIPLACVDTQLSGYHLCKFSYGNKFINYRLSPTWPSYLVTTSIFIQVKGTLNVQRP